MKSSISFLVLSITFIAMPFYMVASPKQPQDTIYIYEKIVVYDTIFRVVTLYDTLDLHYNNRAKNRVPELNILYIDTLRNTASLLSISKDSTATFWLDSIILNVNSSKLKNTESMKKTTFIGIMLLAFQTISFAQMDFGVHVGSGVWWTDVSKSVSDSEIKPIGNVGFDVAYNFKNGIFVKAEPSFLYLSSNYGYKATSNDVLWNPTITEIPSALPTDITGWSPSAGDELATTTINQLSIPIHIGYLIKKFRPYVGMEYGYRFIKKLENSPSFNKSSWSLTAGISYDISSSISLGVSYTKGLTNDIERIGAKIEMLNRDVISVDEYGWKSNRVGFALYYKFGKDKVALKDVK